MPKTPKKEAPKKATAKKAQLKKAVAKKSDAKKAALPPPETPAPRPVPPMAIGASAAVLDRLWGVVMSRRDASPSVSHSARLLARGTAKVAQKLGEEAVECVIEAVAGNRAATIAESADVLYHLLVLWVDAGIRPEEVWTELQRREGVSGIAEKASRPQALPEAMRVETRKIP